VASIIVNLFIWCFLLFLLPNAATFLGKNIIKTDNYKQLQYNTGQLDQEFLKVQRVEVGKILENENLSLTGYQMCAGMDWDGGQMIFFTPKSCMEYERRLKELMNPLILENCDKKWALQSAYLAQTYSQEKTVRYLSCLSPAGIFKQISASLCRTGMGDEVHFMNQARQFQDIFFGYFIQNKIYSSYAYFTAEKEEDFPEDWSSAEPKASEWRAKAKPASTFDLSSFGYVNTDELPRFAYIQPSLGNGLYEQLYLIAGILAVLRFVCFIY
jgi:hypothetical protein